MSHWVAIASQILHTKSNFSKQFRNFVPSPRELKKNK